MNAIRYGASQSVAIGAASVVSTAFSATCTMIRVSASGACYIKIGDGTPVAAAGTSTYMPANIVEYIKVAPGQKAAVIQIGASTGIVDITESD